VPVTLCAGACIRDSPGGLSVFALRWFDTPTGGPPVWCSGGLEGRLSLRHIERALPERMICEAQRNFIDTATGYRIAVTTVVYRGADHLMMVAFEETESEIVAVSIHPLDERDVARKISNGRWRA
jgi:hypothetical protein